MTYDEAVIAAKTARDADHTLGTKERLLVILPTQASHEEYNDLIEHILLIGMDHAYGVSDTKYSDFALFTYNPVTKDLRAFPEEN